MTTVFNDYGLYIPRLEVLGFSEIIYDLVSPISNSKVRLCISSFFLLTFEIHGATSLAVFLFLNEYTNSIWD